MEWWPLVRLLVPVKALLDVHEPEHHSLVPPEGPSVFVELGHQLLLALPVDYQDHSPAPRIEQSDQAIVSVCPRVVYLQLDGSMALSIH
jgi:hypothetical protein